MIKHYISDAGDVDQVDCGEARIDGKQVLPVNADMKLATKRLFFALSSDPSLALVAGKGLSVRGSSGQWRRITQAEFKALILSHFVLVKEQSGEGGRRRFEVLSDVPNPFWLPTLLQGRWLDNEVQSWFPQVDQPTVTIISRP